MKSSVKLSAFGLRKSNRSAVYVIEGITKLQEAVRRLTQEIMDLPRYEVGNAITKFNFVQAGTGQKITVEDIEGASICASQQLGSQDIPIYNILLGCQSRSFHGLVVSDGYEKPDRLGDLLKSQGIDLKSVCTPA